MSPHPTEKYPESSTLQGTSMYPVHPRTTLYPPDHHSIVPCHDDVDLINFFVLEGTSGHFYSKKYEKQKNSLKEAFIGGNVKTALKVPCVAHVGAAA